MVERELWCPRTDTAKHGKKSRPLRERFLFPPGKFPDTMAYRRFRRRDRTGPADVLPIPIKGVIV